MKTLTTINQVYQSILPKVFLLISFLVLGDYSAVAQSTHNLVLDWAQDGISLKDGGVSSFENRALQSFKTNLPSLGSAAPVILDKIYKTKLVDLADDIEQTITNTDFKIEIENIETRGDYELFVNVFPFRRLANGNIEQLQTLDLRIDQVKKTQFFSKGPPNTTESVLASGTFFKIGIPKSGITKIDKSFIEDELKLDLAKINPKSIKIFGNRGGRVVESNDVDRTDDLQELKIRVLGEEDGKFDKDDVILFYAEGPNRLLQINNQYWLEKNIYDFNNYYFITFEGGAGKRIKTIPFEGQPSITFDTYECVERVENDIYNLLGSYAGAEGAGKEWYGENFKIERLMDLSKSFDLKNFVIEKPVDVQMVFAGRNAVQSNVTLSIGNKSITKNINSVDVDGQEVEYAKKTIINESINLSEIPQNISINYPKGSGESEGWLDYLQLTYQKLFKPTGAPFNFRSKSDISSNIVGFKIYGNTTHEIWDVTNPFDVSQKTIEGNVLAYKPAGEIREFCSHNSTIDAQTPSSLGKISNQNIHGIMDAVNLIVYHTPFKAEAERLAKHRNDHSQMKTYSIDVQEVYNEFSSGRVDPGAIRDMAKLQLERNKDFKFLTLFGDGSYDYKGLVKDIARENLIPVYETDESLHPISAFPSDDFYGLLGATEGVNLVGGLDVSVGRLPAKNVGEAKLLVDKIIHYESSPSVYGDWRLRVGVTADDEDSNTHIRDMESIAKSDAARHPLYNQQKVYFDAYPQISTSGEKRFPDANKALNQNVVNGQISLTYLGHGGPLGWAQERVLTVPDIVSWDNYDKMPIMVTATCSFAAYDDPSILTPGEQCILNPKGGAIALFSTTRAVYTNSNKDLTDAVNSLLYKKINGQAPTLGEVLSTGKNKYPDSSFRVNSRKFTLLGDPSMQIAMPKYDILTTKINGKDILSADTFGALEKITVEGFIADDKGKIKSDFNGELTPTVFDKISNLQTLGNDNSSGKFPFDAYRNIIFKGSTTVTDGKWQFSFWVPRTINYDIGSARISYYATDGATKDAGGYFNKLTIGGTNKNVVIDDKGPKIDVFMNNEQFVVGDETNRNPLLLLKLSDDLGINVTGNAIGQDITAVLDDNNKNIFILNDYYAAAKDDFTSGTVKFRLNDLSLGRHTIKAKAWDIAGNSAEASTEFVVIENLIDIIENVLVYPNPFSEKLTFGFNLDNAPSLLNIEVQLFGLDGKEAGTLKISGTLTEGRLVYTFDEIPVPLANGMYIFKIIAKSPDGSYVSESKFEKLIKL